MNNWQHTGDSPKVDIIIIRLFGEKNAIQLFIQMGFYVNLIQLSEVLDRLACFTKSYQLQ